MSRTMKLEFVKAHESKGVAMMPVCSILQATHPAVGAGYRTKRDAASARPVALELVLKLSGRAGKIQHDIQRSL